MTVFVHAIYLLISVFITVVVGRTLHKNGRVFIMECVQETRLADAINNLLLVGYYLVNIAFVVLLLRLQTAVTSLQSVVELLSTKIGIVCLTLGVMHFGNLTVLGIVRRRNLALQRPQRFDDE